MIFIPNTIEWPPNSGQIVAEIPDYPFCYASKTGLIYNIKRRFKTKRQDPLRVRYGGTNRKYARVHLVGKGPRDVYVHRAVLLAWCGVNEKKQAAHQNGKSLDNRLENLKWMTPCENSRQKINHGTSGVGEKNAAAKISDKDARTIVLEYSIKTSHDLSKEFNISVTNVLNIAMGKSRFNNEFVDVYKTNKILGKKRILEALKK